MSKFILFATAALFLIHGSAYAAATTPASETFGPSAPVSTEAPATEEKTDASAQNLTQEEAQAAADITPAAGEKPEETSAPAEEKQPQGRWWDRPY